MTPKDELGLIIILCILLIALLIWQVRKRITLQKNLALLEAEMERQRQYVAALELDNSSLRQHIAAIELENTKQGQHIMALELENTNFQLNPHLFRNTLNTIKSLAFNTNLAIDKLTGVLDYVLYKSDKMYISLKEEMDFVKDFIELNKMRVSPALDIKIDTNIAEDDPLWQETMIAPLITVYFVENAFKHADVESADAFININFEKAGHHFIYSVSNKIKQLPEKPGGEGGIGMKNIAKRLTILYPECHELDYHIENEVYRAFLKIDLNAVKDKMYTPR